MSAARGRRRFGYLSEQETQRPPTVPREAEQSEQVETGMDSLGSNEGGGEGEASTHAAEGRLASSISPRNFSSVPKGQGRMKQERSQLNVRIPTSLKRQASAKAVLEGKDIGEIVEELLRGYLDK